MRHRERSKLPLSERERADLEVPSALRSHSATLVSCVSTSQSHHLSATDFPGQRGEKGSVQFTVLVRALMVGGL